MSDIVNNLIVFSQPVAVAITLVYFFGMFARWQSSAVLNEVAMGLLFATAAVLAMGIPLQIADGVIMDLRNLFIGVAAGLLGWLAGLIALGIGIAARLFIGGVGALPGIVGMSLATGAALFWRYSIRKRVKQKWLGDALLGFFVTAHILAAFMTDSPIRERFLFDLGPILLVCNILGTVLLGGMIRREQLLVSETERLRNDASTDPLTQLINRRRLKEIFGALPTPRGDQQGRAMIYFDIDYFKGINDTYGHAAGDQVLQVLSDRISACLRPQDLFSRLGGDEFLIVLPGISQEAANHVAERCRKIVAAREVQADGHSLPVSISIGVHWTVEPPVFGDDLARADSALYSAKANGRNRVVFQSTANQQLKPVRPAA